MGRAVIGPRRFFLLALTLLLLAGAGVVWVERKPLLAWYYLRRLAEAEGADVATWADRAAGLEELVVSDLVQMLGGEDSRAGANAREALARVGSHWGTDDPRCCELIDQVVQAFPRMSRDGQGEALELIVGFCSRQPCGEILATTAGRLIPDLAHHSDPGLRARGLALALPVVRHTRQPELFCPCRELARSCLRCPQTTTRLEAAELAVQPGMDLHNDLVPLLYDPSAEVRRLAMRVIGPEKEVLLTDHLLPWLQDGDKGVRQLCEVALRKRGLQTRHIRLARLITDSQSQVRLQVLDALDEMQARSGTHGHLDDPGVWLRRLSQDVSPAVRAAAIRAACEDGLADLRDRIEQMAYQDPSPTVCELARYYLRARKVHLPARID